MDTKLTTCKICRSEFYRSCAYSGFTVLVGDVRHSLICPACFHPLGSQYYTVLDDSMQEDLNNPKGMCQTCPSIVKCITIGVQYDN